MSYVKLQSYTLTSGTSTKIVFDNIPQNYQHLYVRYSIRDAGSNVAGGRLIINGSRTGYTFNVIYGTTTGSPGAGSSINPQAIDIGNISGLGRPYEANTYSTGEMLFTNYSDTSKYKTMIGATGIVGGTAASTPTVDFLNRNYQWSHSWQSYDPITSLTLFVQDFTSDMLDRNSTITLYGISGGIRAAGGDRITISNNYVYHTFLSSGTFIPGRPLTVESLVIGGGGGGGGNFGGGGGAGGLVYTASQTLANTPYVVTVGGGGSDISKGTNSSFLKIIGYGGGAGGGGVAAGQVTQQPQQPGGSGGGGSGNNGSVNQGDSVGGTATPAGQGNNGGIGKFNRIGGGGGGSGAVGGAASGTTAGVGGIGLGTYSAWASATNTGVSGYYAAGGGGASLSGFGTGNVGGTGGGGTGPNTGAAGGDGTANTGSGAGGGPGNGAGGNGGSGIIIIRYPL